MMIYNMRYTNLSFGKAFDTIRMDTENLGMRLPSWKEDVIVRVQMPDANSKMTAPYLYVESRKGRVPWKETMIELFSKEWGVVEIIDCKKVDDKLLENVKDKESHLQDKVTIEKVDKIHKIREQNNILNEKTKKEKSNNKIDKVIKSITPEEVKEVTAMYEYINGNCGGSQECKNRCLHECDKKFKFKKMNGEKVRDDSINSLANLIMYLHWLGYDFF